MKARHVLVLLVTVVACSDDGTAPPSANDGFLNHRPVLVELPDTSIDVGSVLQLTVDGSDPEGDSLSFHGSVGSTLTDLRLGTIPVFNFSTGTRTLTFAPQAYDRPRRTAIFWAEDGRGGVDTMTVRVQVN